MGKTKEWFMYMLETMKVLAAQLMISDVGVTLPAPAAVKMARAYLSSKFVFLCMLRPVLYSLDGKNAT
jgi:hypothetical protein